MSPITDDLLDEQVANNQAAIRGLTGECTAFWDDASGILEDFNNIFIQR